MTALRRFVRSRTWSARARLTAVYGAALVLAGTAMLAVEVAVLHRRMADSPKIVVAAAPDDYGVAALSLSQGRVPPPGTVSLPVEQQQFFTDLVRAYQKRILSEAQTTLVLQSVVALVAFTAFATAAGYLLAGRVLRPVRQVTSLARRLGAQDLDRRIARRDAVRDGDELAELVDVFNGMLDRLEGAFEAQRRFVADAGHELRTPIATQRTLLEVSAHPGASPDLQELSARMLPVLDRQHRAVDGLLAVARARSGHLSPVHLDLAAVVRAEVDGQRALARERDVRMDVEAPGPIMVTADRELLELVVGNLLANAVRHGPPGGTVPVRVAPPGLVTVVNDGDRFDAEELAALRAPFRRGGRARTGRTGSGLGLAIADGAAEALGARLVLEPRPEGGVVASLDLSGGPEGQARRARLGAS